MLPTALVGKIQPSGPRARVVRNKVLVPASELGTALATTHRRMAKRRGSSIKHGASFSIENGSSVRSNNLPGRRRIAVSRTVSELWGASSDSPSVFQARQLFAYRSDPLQAHLGKPDTGSLAPEI